MRPQVLPSNKISLKQSQALCQVLSVLSLQLLELVSLDFHNNCVKEEEVPPSSTPTPSGGKAVALGQCALQGRQGQLRPLPSLLPPRCAIAEGQGVR